MPAAKKRGRPAKSSTGNISRKRRRGSVDKEEVVQTKESSSSSPSSSSSSSSSSSTTTTTTTTTTTRKKTANEDTPDHHNSESSEQDDGNDEEEDSDMEYEDEPLEPKILPSRSTRGRRFNKLLGEAVEKDQEFWNHGTWREEEEADEDYTFEDQKDIVDSDFDASEDEEDNQPVEVFKRRKKSKASSSSRYVDPALKNRTAKGAVHNKTSNKRPKKQPVPAKQRTFRSSTKAKVAESNKSRQMKEKRLKTMSAARPLKKQEEKKLTQEELLIQAAYTEVANRRSLELMLRMEDDRKKTTGPKAPYTGKRIRYTSKSGQPNILTFEQFDAIPSIINSKAPPPPKVEYCAITGMKAKYRYLHNGSYIPYATLEAYKQLRAQSK